MKKSMKQLALQTLVLLFVGVGFVACDKDNDVTTPEEETIAELPSDAELQLLDAEEMMADQFVEGEEFSYEAFEKTAFGNEASKSDAASKNDILEYTFEAEVTKGPSAGAQLAADLKFKFTFDFGRFKIFRGMLDLGDDARARVSGVVIRDEIVYLFTRIPGVGYVKGFGRIAADGVIAGPFHLFNNDGRSAGDWTATPGGMVLPSIVEIAVSNPDFSTLVGALQAAELVEALQGDGPFTVFAPVNSAFEALDAIPEGDALKEVLLYHVAAGAFDAASLLEKKTVTTLQGDEVTIEVIDGKVLLNGSVEVVTADVKASNGIVHVITGVLIPPMEPALPSIVEIATSNPDFSTLVGALQAADLVGALQGDGPFTVFAPVNSAFDALDAIPGGDALKEVLLYHVAAGAFDAASLLEKQTVTTLQGDEVTIEMVNGKVLLNGAIEVVSADIQASNGIVHVITGVLLPPVEPILPSIVEIATSNPDFTELVGALQTAGLVSTLEGDGPFTVFAPTNKAFEALGNLPAGDLLTDVLTYHVVSGAFDAQKLLSEGSVTTVQGQDIRIRQVGNQVILNESIAVTIADIQASNGIVHVIENVLLPSIIIIR